MLSWCRGKSPRIFWGTVQVNVCGPRGCSHPGLTSGSRSPWGCDACHSPRSPHPQMARRWTQCWLTISRALGRAAPAGLAPCRTQKLAPTGTGLLFSTQAPSCTPHSFPHIISRPRVAVSRPVKRGIWTNSSLHRGSKAFVLYGL